MVPSAERSVALAQRGGCPADRAAHAEHHQRAAVGQVDAHPVPARRGPCRRSCSTTRDRATPRPSHADGDPQLRLARHRQVRFAVVVARRARIRALATVTALALQQDGLRRVELNVEGEVVAVSPSRHNGPVLPVAATSRRVAHRPARARERKIEARARGCVARVAACRERGPPTRRVRRALVTARTRCGLSSPHPYARGKT